MFAASVYGMNDVTHLGIFDIPMISNIPNLVYLAPTTKEEYFAMLHWSMTQREHPVAIRVPAYGVLSDGKAVTKDFGKLNTYEVTQAMWPLSAWAGFIPWHSKRRRNMKSAPARAPR